MSAAVETPIAAPRRDAGVAGVAAARQPPERLIAVLGHELRNPLAAALTGVAMAAELTDAADPRAEYLSRSLVDLERLGGLIDSYLDFARRPSIRAETVDMIAPAARAIERVTEARLVCDLDSLIVDGDSLLLERVLDNLLVNAVQAGAKSIRVQLGRAGRHAQIDVIDDGPGVPHQLLPHLFSPFVSGRGGSGLGLAVASDTLRAHGGSICLLPSFRGAHFRITL